MVKGYYVYLHEFLRTLNLFIISVEVLECVIIYDEIFLLLILFNISVVDLLTYFHA
jgi:hypothetical protein